MGGWLTVKAYQCLQEGASLLHSDGQKPCRYEENMQSPFEISRKDLRGELCDKTGHFEILFANKYFYLFYYTLYFHSRNK